MADNVTANAGSGGAVFATDDNGGVHYPYCKLAWGADGTFNIADTASGKAIPVQLRDSTGTEIVPLTTNDFDTKAGSLTETAPATDTASSGLNGRLQRIAQRITALMADGGETTFGSKADAKSASTDATAITAMQVWKQISASVQSLVTGIVTLGSTTASASIPVTLATDDAIVGKNTRGDVASGATDSGNPVKVGGLAKTALPTAVTDAQRVAALFSKIGALVSIGALPETKVNQKTTITASTSETPIVTAVASIFLDLYMLLLSNTSATACAVTIKDATAGTTRAIINVPAGETRGFALPIDSAHPQAASNNNWTATCGTSVSSIEITALCVKRN